MTPQSPTSSSPESEKAGRQLNPAIPNLPWQDRPVDSQAVVWRHTENPILTRRHFTGVLGIFNSAVVPFEDRFVGVFRIETHTRFPFLYVGWSDDGLHWDIRETPIDYDVADPEIGHGDYAYDPRVCWLDGSYYVTWCGGHNGPTISIARTQDFERFERLESAFLPFNRNGVLFPRKINGSYAMLSRPSDDGHTPFGDIYLSHSPDMTHWGRHRLVMRRGGQEHGSWWQGTKIGAGPIPIETSDGWLMIYHGTFDTCSGFVYNMGAAILDRDEPWKVRYRCTHSLLAPEEDYEVSGHVPNVIFPCAAMHDSASDRLAVYYGAADTSCCVAYARMSELLAYIKQNSVVF